MKEYMIDGIDSSKENFIKEILYQLYLERVSGDFDKGLMSPHRLRMHHAVNMVINNESESVFFEIGHKIFRCYDVKEEDIYEKN